MLKNLVTVRGRQYIDAFSQMSKDHIYPIVGTVNDCYSQFPKQDANYLCTKTFSQYFVKQGLMVPWNIIILDEDPECDMNNYVFGTHDIEVILLFRLSLEEVIQVTIAVGTLDALIEYRQLVNDTWCTVMNEYSSAEATPTVQNMKGRVCYMSIKEYCEAHNKQR